MDDLSKSILYIERRTQKNLTTKNYLTSLSKKIHLNKIMKYNIDQKCKILKALSHPDRMKIVVGLFHDECNVSACQKKMNLPQSTISQHLKTIKEAGICISKRKGNEVCYQVVDKFTIEIIKIIEG